MFVQDNIYVTPYIEGLFLCENLSGIGKVVLYSKINNNTYKRSRMQYFINDYNEGDFKEVVLNDRAYEQVGVIGNNFIITDDRQLLRRLI